MVASDGEMSGDEFDYSPAAAPLPEGVQKEVLEKGDSSSWRKPKEGDEISCHYIGTLEDGTQFDSSRDRGQIFSFPLGKGKVIKGMDLGIATMTKGEKAKLTLAPEYAYGEHGQAPKIPPNAALIFEVELLSWVSKDDLFDDGGAVKSITQEGTSTFENPKKGGEVCMSMKVVAQNGDVIEQKDSIDYVIGSEELGVPSKVIDKTLLTMSKDEKCSITCAKEYLYKGSKYGIVTIELHLQTMYNTNDVSLLKDGSVMKKEIKEGEGHEKPEDDYSVTVKVESATDASGVPLPGFVGPKNLTFKCCNGDVCDALEGSVRDMKKGEHAVVTITVPWKIREPKLGLSDVKAPKVILKLELLDFAKRREQWRLTDDDKVDLALLRKDVGAKLFKSKRFELALDKYKKVNDTIGSHDSFHAELKKSAIELKRTVELNKAACYLQINDPTSALTSCNKVLKEDRNNVKALFRRAKAHHGRTEHTEAAADLERVLELEPDNKEAKTMLPVVRKAQKVADKESRATFAKMCEGFGKLGSERKVKEPEKAEEPQEPEVNKEIVTVAFKIEYKPQPGETLHLYGAPEPLGEWKAAGAVAMTKLPEKWEPPVGSGRAPPEYHHWEAMVDLREELGRFEYKYIIKGPAGDRIEEGTSHKCDLSGMGGSRVRCSDSWRGEGK